MCHVWTLSLRRISLGMVLVSGEHASDMLTPCVRVTRQVLKVTESVVIRER